MNPQNKNIKKYLIPIYILTVFVLFFPQFQSFIGLILEQLLAVIVIVTSIVFFITLYPLRIRLIHVLIFFSFLVLITISLIRGLDENFQMNDIFELSKPFYLGLTFALSYSINWDINKIKKYFSFIIICFFILGFFGIFESVSNIGNTIGHTIYKDMRGGVQFKAVASFISPYVFASILMIPFFYFFCMTFATNFKLFSFLGMLFFLLLILLTQSRTVLISLVITLFIIPFVTNFSKAYVGNKRVSLFIVFIVFLSFIFLPIIVSVIETNFKYIFQGLNLLYLNVIDFNFERFIYSTPSISNRYEQIVFVIDNIDIIPLVGVNIGKSQLNPESLYAMYLYRVGFIGIFIHFSIICICFIKCLLVAKTYKNDTVFNSIFMSIAFYMISLPFSYASSALNDQVRSGFIFYMIVGMVFSFYNKRGQ
ncbi:hypothetical protein MED121_02345 [Marinomonas sp. MED121]|uniref:hypothetical protein n=1 Tax=Marinomonas sp. MED121 TaxID=314277 RepID=UPI0000690B7B|nr:hypothetical protein [Marinomonas sp. MED121]EAQ66014.1 hypothetical protein MED121_02345 [Marinomonas sp. MED121]